MKDLGKGLIQVLVGAVAQRPDTAAKGATEALLAVSIEKSANAQAWSLITSSLGEATRKLMVGNLDLFETTEEDAEQLGSDIDVYLPENLPPIDASFFLDPTKHLGLAAITDYLSEWLAGKGAEPAAALAVSRRLRTYFVYELLSAWNERAAELEPLRAVLNNPFGTATRRETEWKEYEAWLERQLDEPLFGEAFSLRDIYVPLRGYKAVRRPRFRGGADSELGASREDEHIAFDLKSELETWIDRAVAEDALRVLSGGPGSGKSSFARIFAASEATRGRVRVILIPLHQFDLRSDLRSAISSYLRESAFFSHDPLDKDVGESRLLIIFDGLDELTMQGRGAEQIAQEFVTDVEATLGRRNQLGTCLQVIITGRQLVIQQAATLFRRPEQVLHLLPYHLTASSRREYQDSDGLLGKDQRHDWWAKYGKLTGRKFSRMPKALQTAALEDVTSQPLLNYLIALSYVRGRVKFNADTNLNDVYEDLLLAIYARGWARRQHASLRNIDKDSFVRVLEEIGLSAWHGDGRTTTVREIEKHCENSGLSRLLDGFQDGAKGGVTRLLAAFYFRQSGQKEGEKTFEFTHKSFGEYLTARRIVTAIRRITEELATRDNRHDRGWSEKDALSYWAEICGPAQMDQYLWAFLRREISRSPKSDVGKWQEVLRRLFEYSIRFSMPLERGETPRPFGELARRAKHADESLLAALACCSRVTKIVTEIKWPASTALGEWVGRIQGQRTGSQNPVVLRSLCYLNCSSQVLYVRDFFSADFEGSIFKKTQFNLSCVMQANFKGASFENCSFFCVDARQANFERATLRDVDFHGADLRGASFVQAIMTIMDFTQSYIQGTDFDGTHVKEEELAEAFREDMIPQPDTHIRLPRGTAVAVRDE